MTWTGDPIWLADVLRAAGLRVIEHEGWRGRGHGDFRDLRGVLCHHTGGGGENDWRTVQYGRPDLEGPLAQLVLERDGTYRVIAVGVCWHAGRGRWPGWPTDNANYHVIGIEAVSRGDGTDWTPAQLDAYQRGCAAILRRIGRTAADCVAHREYSSEGKVDPAGIDMPAFRAAVQALIDHIPEEDTMGLTPHQATQLDDIQTQLRGPRLRGWPQLGTNAKGEDLTLVDAVATLRAEVAELRAAIAALRPPTPPLV